MLRAAAAASRQQHWRANSFRSSLPFLSNNWMTRSRHHYPPSLLPTPPLLMQCRRHYWFLPTSWTELKLRWQTAKERHIVHVQLLRHEYQQRWQAAKDKVREHDQSLSRHLMQSGQRWNQKRLARRAQRQLQRQQWQHRLLLQTRRWRNVSASYRIAPPRSSKNNNIGRDDVDQQITTTTIAVALDEVSHPEWFDNVTGRPLTSRDATGRFVNPWSSQSTAGVHSLATILLWLGQRAYRLVLDNVLMLGRWSNHDARRHGATTQNDQTAPDKNTILANLTTPSPPPLAVPLSLQQQTPTTTNSKSDRNQTYRPTITSRLPADNVTDPPSHSDALKFTWLGHNTCLLQHNSIFILLDPMFSTRASPFGHWPAWADVPGIARVVPPACAVDALPGQIDVCVISHDHYDHLDTASVRALRHQVAVWVVPVGMGDWLQEKGHVDAACIVELEWWEAVQLQRMNGDEQLRRDKEQHHSNRTAKWKVAQRHLGVRQQEEQQNKNITGAAIQVMVHPALRRPEDNGNDDDNALWITCLPAQHWAGRTFWDRNYRLWASFAVHFRGSRQPHGESTAPGPSFYFAGDTALPSRFPLFAQIGDYIGAVDLAALPIGAYEPSHMMRDSHMNPAQAVQVHNELRAHQSVGVHWGSFPLSEEPLEEPPLLLERAVREYNNAPQDDENAPHRMVKFGTIPLGSSIEVRSWANASIYKTDEALEESSDTYDETDSDWWDDERHSSSANL